MDFKASEAEVKKMVLLAVNSSSPVGMGFLHYERKDYSLDDIDFKDISEEIDIDYFRGRMVKLSIKRLHPEGDDWQVPDHVDPEYQSWSQRYPGYEDLLLAAKG